MEKKFWDIKAKKYPRPFEGKRLLPIMELIEKIERLGVIFENSEIVDIGCGPGSYALPLSAKAKSVFCTDFSTEMMEILKKEILEKAIKNVEFLQTDFADFPAEKYEKKFNIALASMTPAVRTEKDVLKMEKLARDWCVLIGWAGKRKNPLAEEVLSLHGIEHYIPKGFLHVKEILEKRKIPFRAETFNEYWNWEGSLSEAEDDLSARIKLDGKEPDKTLISSFLRKKFPDGKVLMTTEAAKGLLIWKPQGDSL